MIFYFSLYGISDASVSLVIYFGFYRVLLAVSSVSDVVVHVSTRKPIGDLSLIRRAEVELGGHLRSHASRDGVIDDVSDPVDNLSTILEAIIDYR